MQIHSVTAPACVEAPSLHAKNIFGRDLQALGATTVTPLDPFTLQARFEGAVAATVAANLVNSTLKDATIRYEMPLTGIPYMMSTSDVVQALRSLPGVRAVYDGTPEDRPVFSIMADTKADADRLDQLLRDNVQLQGRGGWQQHEINVTHGPIVEFGAGA